jgi:hypothetical protein
VQIPAEVGGRRPARRSDGATRASALVAAQFDLRNLAAATSRRRRRLRMAAAVRPSCSRSTRMAVPSSPIMEPGTRCVMARIKFTQKIIDTQQEREAAAPHGRRFSDCRRRRHRPALASHVRRPPTGCATTRRPETAPHQIIARVDARPALTAARPLCRDDASRPS